MYKANRWGNLGIVIFPTILFLGMLNLGSYW